MVSKGRSIMAFQEGGGGGGGGGAGGAPYGIQGEGEGLSALMPDVHS